MLKIKEHLANKKHLIWDWNGTLLDDVDAVVEVMGGILEGQGMARIDRARYLEVFGFPIAEYYRRLGFDFEKVPFETLSDAFVAGYRARVQSIPLHAGAKELLAALKEEGIQQSVLSAAKEDDLRMHLTLHGILDYFDHVYGLNDHHAVSKVQRGLELIADTGIDPKRTLLVGDTDHDLEVGQALGVDVLLLNDGHQSFERLSQIHHRVLPLRR